MCNCRICTRNRRAIRSARTSSRKQTERVIVELLNELACIGMDYSVEKAIAAGDWPESVEILERRLETAKKKKASPDWPWED